MNKMLRFAIFIDGNYFIKVSDHYKFYHLRKQRISFDGLIEFIRNQISLSENIDTRYCQCVEAHWFRGRFTMPQIINKYPDEEKRLKYLSGERYIDDSLMFEGITQHVYPMKVNVNTQEAEEKGIDVWFALEAYELAYLKRYDVIALVACDTDYVPLARKLNGLGTRVALVSWDFKNDFFSIRTSQALIDECSYYLAMHELIDRRDNHNNLLVERLFYSPI
jgi:uncharacterized LabA/DUF88 family protein